MNFRTTAALDYETFSEFLFRVHVRDSGQPPRNADSPAVVVVKVSGAGIFVEAPFPPLAWHLFPFKKHMPVPQWPWFTSPYFCLSLWILGTSVFCWVSEFLTPPDPPKPSSNLHSEWRIHKHFAIVNPGHFQFIKSFYFWGPLFTLKGTMWGVRTGACSTCLKHQKAPIFNPSSCNRSSLMLIFFGWIQTLNR